MGEIVEFPSNGSACRGYLATPDGEGPGIVVIQEWWGLVDHITDVCDRFASQGFVALAPDLYHGETADEPDEAQKLAMSLELDRAARDMSGAESFLRGHDRVSPKKVGTVGYCMGGALTLVLASIAPIDACAPYYGLPNLRPEGEPDYAKITCPVQGHYATRDGMFPPDTAREVFEKIAGPAEVHEYDADHGFFNDTNPGVHDPDAASQAWTRTLAFFREHLS